MSRPPQLRVTGMTVWHLSLPVQSIRSHGSGDVVGAVEVVVLRLDSDAGLVGWGEASPWAVFTGTAEASAAALDRYLRPLAIGADPFAAPAVMAAAGRALVGHGEAKAALEMALYDLAGQAAGLPVAALLGGRCRARIPLSISLADPDLVADLALAEARWAEGVRIFKVKTGFADHATDLHRLERLRATLPDEAELRIDYNQGLEPFDALRRLRDLEGFRPGFIEQPVPATRRAAMAALTAALDTPILADESVFTPDQAIDAVRERIADGISVKIMKCGGMARGQQIAAIAAAAGLAGYGGDMFETGLAHLAGAQMIAATPGITLGCEFYQARWYLAEDILAEPFPIEDGAVVVPTAPGLGIPVDAEKVSRFALAKREG